MFWEKLNCICSFYREKRRLLSWEKRPKLNRLISSVLLGWAATYWPLLKLDLGLPPGFAFESWISEDVLVDDGFVQRNVHRVSGGHTSVTHGLTPHGILGNLLTDVINSHATTFTSLWRKTTLQRQQKLQKKIYAILVKIFEYSLHRRNKRVAMMLQFLISITKRSSNEETTEERGDST